MKTESISSNKRRKYENDKMRLRIENEKRKWLKLLIEDVPPKITQKVSGFDDSQLSSLIYQFKVKYSENKSLKSMIDLERRYITDKTKPRLGIIGDNTIAHIIASKYHPKNKHFFFGLDKIHILYTIDDIYFASNHFVRNIHEEYNDYYLILYCISEDLKDNIAFFAIPMDIVNGFLTWAPAKDGQTKFHVNVEDGGRKFVITDFDNYIDITKYLFKTDFK